MGRLCFSRDVVAGSSTIVSLSIYSLVCFVLAGFLAHGQTYYQPNQEVRIGDLPPITARSKDSSDILAAAVEIILRDKKVCCGKDSALEDSIQRANPKSLKDIGDKIRGRQLLSDGRPIMITAEYTPGDSINAGQVIGELRDKRPMLVEWNSHLYVLYGAAFYETEDPTNGVSDTIQKLFLLDLRFSDERRQVFFDRQTDDLTKLQGALTLRALPQ